MYTYVNGGSEKLWTVLQVTLLVAEVEPQGSHFPEVCAARVVTQKECQYEEVPEQQ